MSLIKLLVDPCFFREIPFAWAQLARYNSIISPERYPRDISIVGKKGGGG